MTKFRDDGDTISEISVDPYPSGLRAVFLVETASAEEARAVARLFAELGPNIAVKQLSRGKLMSFAVQADDSDSEVLDELDAILRADYGFVVTQRSFDETIFHIVKELCRDTGSKLLSVGRCNICGRTEPFPNTVISLSDAAGSVRISRIYCGRCTAEAVAPNNKQFVRSLLAADKRDFRAIERAELVRHPSRTRSIRFKVKA